MSAALLILLLGAVRWTAGHSIYGKDPGRPLRHPYEEWRPVREAPGFGRHVPPGAPPRYPVFHHNKGYSYAPSKKILNQQLAETSDTVEVFSPAPPSILGSFSVFGHATVNAREPASHVIKKSPRPQYTADYPHYERPKLNEYQVRNQFASPGFYQPNDTPKRPHRYSDYNDPYFFDATLRPPPRDSINKVSEYSPHAQSTSLSPNSFYFEQPQPFQPSAVDNSFDKMRKPIHSYHYSATSGFSTAAPIDFRTTVNEYEQPAGSYYNSYNKKGYQSSSSWKVNPFGDVNLSTRHPEVQIKPVVEDKEQAKDIYNQYSHLSRPFQSSQYTTTDDSQKEVDTYSPYVTTFSSPIETHNVKFSDVAQPFQVNDNYRTQGVPLNKPDYVVTQDPYSQDVYPITVTTIEPTEPSRDTKKKHKDSFKGDSFMSELNSRPFSKSKNKNTYESHSNHRPQVQITSYQGFNERVPPPFLPTPTPDAHSYIPQPTMDEQTTDQPEVSSNAQDLNYISTIDNKYQDKSDEATDYPVITTTVLETTTTPSPRTRATIKSRRRPSRPSQTSKTSEGSKYKNHRVPDDEYSTTADYYKYQRRRKPSNKFRDSSEYKRFRTTTTSTTTTPSPVQFETTEPYEETTVQSEAPKVVNNYILGKPQENQFSNIDQYYASYNADRLPNSDIIYSSQAPERDLYNLNYADIFAETTPSTSTTTTSTTPSTTSTTTTSSPVSVTTPNLESTSSTISARLKNKYGSNRPRFSIKEYRERLNRPNSTTAAPVNDEDTSPKPKTDVPKILSRMRLSQQQRQTTEVSAPQEDETTSEPKYRKYKPRLGPSRTFYKTSTTAQPEPVDTTTTERVNTFRPSTNRYKPGTGKYYSRYRTSSLSPKEVDDSPVTTTARITIKPKGVFSAKRRPYPMKSKTDYNREEDDASEEAASTPNFGDTLKINDNEVVPGILTKKMDDGLTTTISSSEEKDLNSSSEASTSSSNSIPNLPPTGIEAMRVADLTSSSSNDFHSSSYFKTNVVNRRVLPKISLPTDEPILPLEAFFQTKG